MCDTLISMKTRELSILGYAGENLENSLSCQQEKNTHLAVFLSGIGYTLEHPALYFSRMLLYQLGADELKIEPTYRRSKFKAFTDREKEESIVVESNAILEIIRGLRQYTRITFVGKSMGTLLLAKILEQGLNLETEFIWLTPLLKNQQFFEVITTKSHQGIFFIGSSDQHYDPVLLEQVRAANNSQVIIFEGANHSLEIRGDVLSSINIQTQIVKNINEFVVERFQPSAE